MVAGDEDRGDAGGPARGDGGGRGGARRVEDRDEAEQPKVSFVVAGVVGNGVAVRLGHGEDPESVVGERVGAIRGLAQHVRVIGEDRRVQQRLRARPLQMIWYAAAGQQVRGAHPFAVAVERRLALAGQCLVDRVDVDAELAAGGQQRGLGGIADGQPVVVVGPGWAQRRVAAQHGRP